MGKASNAWIVKNVFSNERSQAGTEPGYYSGARPDLRAVQCGREQVGIAMSRSCLKGALPALLGWCMMSCTQVIAEGEITELKDLRLDTQLVKAGEPQAVIVAPPGATYEAAVNVVQEAIQERAGARLPVLRDEAQTAKPDEILATRNVIALGNMATNPFTERMYRQWYVLLDLRYPGPKGHVVRSLHNPYGTSHNVIWLGGSDDAGVLAAAQAFAGGLRGDANGNLDVGWLMEIKLGEGMTPPKVGDLVYSWRDSFRERPDDGSVGYGPSTYFGWNPISIAGALYYMTGDKEYLDEFKAMAMPDPDNIPEPNRTDDAFNDPMNPLVLNYHYRAHLVDCVFDLIEESPLFTDEERLFITNKLLDHQRLQIWGETLEPWAVSDNYRAPHASRHGMWHLLCIYTGSRYFDKYYPNPRWQKRMQNVRESFEAWIGDPTWGEMDTLQWVSTSTEPVFEFFMLDGFDEFVASGTASTMMSALETLWTNVQFDESNSSLPISLLHKAAHMMGDGRYIWLRDRCGFDLTKFRIGQSFWPSPDLAIERPADIVDQVSYFPLPRTRWQQTGETVPLEEGFHFLAYRAGLTPEDDLLQVDGFYGKARTPYHVNALYTLRMFGGKTIFKRAYANQVTVRSNGMVEPVVPRATALKRAEALGGAAHLHVNVPNMAFSAWDRHLVYVPDNYLIAVDEVTPRETGVFDVTVKWAVLGKPAQDKDDPRRAVCPNGPVVQCSLPLQITEAPDAPVVQTYSGPLTEGEGLTVANIIYWSDQANALSFTIDPVGPHANVIHGTSDAFVTAGDFASEEITTDAAMAYVSASRIILSGVTRLVCGGVEVVRCDKPVSLSWHLDANEVAIEAGEDCRLVLASAAGAVDVAKGTRRLTDVGPSDEARRAMSAALGALKREVKQPSAAGLPAKAEAEAAADWRPTWEAALPDGMVTRIAPTPSHDPKRIWAATCDCLPQDMYTALWLTPPTTYSLSLMTLDGKTERTFKLDDAAYTLWPASDEMQQKAFSVLVGLRNDILRAYSDTGDTLWEQKAQVDPVFKIGDRYDAPWFSDPRRGHIGVFSLMVGDLWGKGSQEIVLGRPVTLEFRRLDGTLIQRVATHWGDNTTLAPIRKRGSEERGPLVLTGKFYCGTDYLSAVNEDYENISDGFHGGVAAGATQMAAWQQRGVRFMRVSDLDGDGVEEVIVVRSGHWNELDVYSGGTDECLWTASFGPDMKFSRFMTGLAISDLTGDGKREIVVGMRNGWVCAFDCAGESIWQQRFPSAVTTMCETTPEGRVAVGRKDGLLHLMDGAGKTVQTAGLGSSVTALSAANGFLLAGTEAGKLVRFGVE